MASLFDIITPTNISEEKDRFFNSSIYNPQFIYNWDKQKIKPNSKYFPLFQALQNQNHENIVIQAQNIFETNIDKKVLEQARDIVKSKAKTLSQSSKENIIKNFNTAFDFFGLDYSLQFTNAHAFNFRPKFLQKIIAVSKDVNFQFFSLDGNIKHEITHIIRYENGKFNNVKKSYNQLPTEEGIASYMQDYHSEDNNNSLFQHAAEYIATSIGLKGGLRDIYNFFLSIGFSKELAWHRAIRHKFGFKDTGIPGDIIKPAMYFSNEMKVKNLPVDEKIRLLVGKISIDDLPKFPVYMGNIPVEKIEEFYDI